MLTRSVVGLDLTLGQEIHIEDRPLPYWYRKGLRGDRSLVCLDCFLEGTTTPLVVKGKLHGQRRPHFAHPPYCTPDGGHSLESAKHAESKQRMAMWARQLPNVGTVIIEHPTSDRRRRSDVAVRLDSGRQIALEVQLSDITDHEWQRRHDSYRRLGIIDIWFWNPVHGPRRIALEHGNVPWTYDLCADRIGVPIANGHDLHGRWWLQPAATLVAHHPPCPDDDITIQSVPLDQCRLSAHGLVLPNTISNELAERAYRAHRDLMSIRLDHDQRERLQRQQVRLCRRIASTTRQLSELRRPAGRA